MTPRAAADASKRLPQLLARKLYKTGQTRGATVREIYQNRVNRNSTVLIPHAYYEACKTPDDGTDAYENGFIVLVEPSWYFTTADPDAVLAAQGLVLGENAILLFQRRSDWLNYASNIGPNLPNGMPFVPATARLNPLGGVYMARVHSTTAEEDGEAVVHGYTTTAMRGAGIRVYEYASTDALRQTRIQLEAMVWLCEDSISAMVDAGMNFDAAKDKMKATLKKATAEGLLDLERLRKARMLDDENTTVCPLCLERISAASFLKREEQAEGRETHDNTVTELGLFHIDELRVGRLGHKAYNLGWGHHYCNVVVKDAGIIPTLRWMKRVLDNNGDSYEAIDEQEALVEEAVEQ